MTYSLESMILIFVVVPILLYVGYNLYVKEEVSKKLIYVVLALSIVVVIDHSIKIFKIVNGFSKQQKFNKSVGLFFIVVAILVLSFNVYNLFFGKKEIGTKIDNSNILLNIFS